MKDIVIIKAKTDLGVHVDGADEGPDKIYNNNSIVVQKDNIIKSKDKRDLRKNELHINKFNKGLYNQVYKVLESKKFPIILGGDHSLAIGSALASNDYNNGIGVIWVDAHTDFNTFETTRTGNIHGLPLAAIAGYHCEELYSFSKSNVNPKNIVVVGARSVDPWEIGNVIDAGVTMITTDEVIKMGAEEAIKKAFLIASNGTNGVHISYDLDFIDPVDAPGVSIPETNGIKKDLALQIADEINKYNNVVSYDIVELNPSRDINNKTEIIAKEVLQKIKQNLN